VAAALPAVDVIDLPPNPAGYLRALADRPTLAAPPPTAADRVRARSYAAARQAALSAAAAGTIEEFLDGLRMRATVRRLGPADLNRAAQLAQKTNQFNLTTARRGREELAGLATDPRWLCYVLELSDRFADHGATGLLLARLDGPAAELDTLLLSCRIIGRTAERRLLAVAATGARTAGCRVLRGVYVPSDRNGLVRSLYPSLGFAAAELGSSRCTYEYDLMSGPPLDTPHISASTIVAGTVMEDGNG
jgi:FkbH-like protein